MTQIMSQQISSINLLYILFNENINFFIFKIIFLFWPITITRFFLFFHCLLPRDLTEERKRRSPQPQLFTVWDSHNCSLCECNHTATVVFHNLFRRDPDKNKRKKRSPQPQLFFTTFSHVTLTKERKRRNPRPQLLTVWVLLKWESLLHNIRVWYFRKIVVSTM